MTRFKSAASVAKAEARSSSFPRLKTRKGRITWAAAMRAAPWKDYGPPYKDDSWAKFRLPAHAEQTFREAFASELVAMGCALRAGDSGGSGPSGPSGKSDLALLQIRGQKAELDAVRAKAKKAGVSTSKWILDLAAGAE